jgi:hypothetical protein
VAEHAHANITQAYMNIGRPIMRDGGTDEQVINAVNAFDPTTPRTRVGLTVEEKALNKARKQCADLAANTGNENYHFDNLDKAAQKKIVAAHLRKINAKLAKDKNTSNNPKLFVFKDTIKSYIHSGRPVNCIWKCSYYLINISKYRFFWYVMKFGFF